MATRSTNTFPEILQKMLHMWADAKTLQDSDLPFCVTEETHILSKLRQPVDQSAQDGSLPGQGTAPPMDMGGGPQMPPMPPVPPPGAAGMGGLMPQAQIPPGAMAALMAAQGPPPGAGGPPPGPPPPGM